MSQNQTLAEVVKTVDSSCPDPFNDPEKFSVYFAQKTLSSRSISDDLDNEDDGEVAIAENVNSLDNSNNPLVRLQNLRMEEQRGFQIERENYETRLGQFSILQQEIEMLRKQNSEHEIQLEFLKIQKPNDTNDKNESGIVIENLKNQVLSANQTHLNEISTIKLELDHLRAQNELKDAEIGKIEEKFKCEIELLKKENSQYEETLLKLETSEEKEREVREISEENVRIKIEFNELQKELAETKTQLADLEVKKHTLLYMYYLLYFYFYFFRRSRCRCQLLLFLLNPRELTMNLLSSTFICRIWF